MELQCPLCGSRDRPVTYFRGQHDLFACSECDLIFSQRIADPDFYGYYTENRDGFYERPYFTESEVDKKRNPDYPNYLHALQRVRQPDCSPAPTLLDVGCGTGTLLKVADQVGFRAEGLEVSSCVSQRARKHFQIHLYDGTAGGIPGIGPYDVITMWDVLEHLPDPVQFLRALRRMLKRPGLLLVRTINEDNLLSQISILLYRITGRRLKAPADRMHEPYHVIYFNRLTLIRCLTSAGFQPKHRWTGEFPVQRAASGVLARGALRCAYLLQKLARRQYEQYVICEVR